MHQRDFCFEARFVKQCTHGYHTHLLLIQLAITILFLSLFSINFQKEVGKIALGVYTRECIPICTPRNCTEIRPAFVTVYPRASLVASFWLLFLSSGW
jgi:hypothetical protein